MTVEEWRSLAETTMVTVMASLISAMGKADEMNKAVHSLDESPDLWLSSAVVGCASDFIEAELDWKTEGARGYGRVTEAIPRLAGWFRQEFSRSDQGALTSIRREITTAFLAGYCTNILLEQVARQQIYRPQAFTQEQVWRKWVPLLYGAPGAADAMSAVKPMVERILPPTLDRFKQGLEGAGIRVGSLARPRLQAVVNGYVEGGVLLRQVEIWGRFELKDGGSGV